MTPMGAKKRQPWAKEAWELARRQHWVVARGQLLELGMSSKAIRHRLSSGRLHRLVPGVYAVGRPRVSQRGLWMAAVLACGPGAMLSHASASALWGIHPPPGRRGSHEARGRPPHVHILTPGLAHRARPGIQVHRRIRLRDGERREVDGIPLTDPLSTLVDVAVGMTTAELERALNEAVQRDLVDPEAARIELDDFPQRPGAGRVRQLLDRDTLVLTDTRLEQLFVPVARDAGLPPPQTQAWLNGHRVDFYWPELGLVVEADSLRYHRTAAKQAADARRDQSHVAAGLIGLRFPHSQIRYEPEYVRRILAATVARAQSGSAVP
jgi:very-short-patch-repair endonuclease